MEQTHRGHVEALLRDAGAEHASLMSDLSPELQASLAVDAQGITRAIDHLAAAAGLADSDRDALIRPHAVNPAVLHARVFGRAPLARETVIGPFVEGARVRADALAALADTVSGEELGREIRRLLVAHPPPVGADGADVVPALRATYAAHERACLMIAESLDGSRRVAQMEPSPGFGDPRLGCGGPLNLPARDQLSDRRCTRERDGPRGDESQADGDPDR